MSGLHRFRNSAKAMALTAPSFQQVREHGLVGLSVENLGGDLLRGADGTEFTSFSFYSYLGLENHPKVIEGAIDALRRVGMFRMPMSRMRANFDLVEQIEADLSDLWRCNLVLTSSASNAALGVLPLMAAGLIGEGEAPVMVFDAHSHFCMNLAKPVCADETEVLTCPHNDWDFLEDVCKRHKHVAYVGDGVYSMGGASALDELLRLQDKYGLYLYFDDTHSVSLYGEFGEGFVRARTEELHERTLIAASLGKGFGASGGAILMHERHARALLTPYGGPVVWSQSLNVPSLGAIVGSIEVHRTPELAELQEKLRRNIELFDRHIGTSQQGSPFPVRVIRIGAAEEAAEISGELLRRGFYCSAVFFPIVARGQAGLRAMLRANQSEEQIIRFCDTVKDVVGEERLRELGTPAA